METAVDRVCASCGNTCLPDGQFCLHCGDLLPESHTRATKLTEPTNSTVQPAAGERLPVKYGGFWLRVWAGLIDIAIESVAALLLSLGVKLLLRALGVKADKAAFLTGMAFIVMLTIGAWLYCAFMESSAWRATIGKRIVGLQVVNSAGGRISFAQATIRHLMKFLSLFTAGFGFLMAGWTNRRQALHDIPCDCLVMRVPKQSICPAKE
jgi:uncharacterized RDD family membrane protein YckC